MGLISPLGTAAFVISYRFWYTRGRATVLPEAEAVPLSTAPRVSRLVPGRLREFAVVVVNTLELAEELCGVLYAPRRALGALLLAPVAPRRD